MVQVVLILVGVAMLGALVLLAVVFALGVFAGLLDVVLKASGAVLGRRRAAPRR